MNSKEQLIRRLAVPAIVAVGVIHLALAKDQWEEQAYLGAMFVAGGIGAVLVGVRLWFRSDTAAWSLGAVIAAGMFAGFILSRTTGLPGFKETEWELSGIVSLVLEAGFLGAFAAAVRARRERPAAFRGVPFQSGARVPEAARR